jgi:D-alanyl-D-alanine carboxypeptidase/D-alanyl-D-alanine-endopeptidase (penicillin-binding protein 4)
MGNGFRLLAGIVLVFHSLISGQGAELKSARRSTKSVSGLQGRLSAFLNQPRFSAAAWGVKVVSLQTGKTLFEHNAGKLLKPASNAKLYTAALALDRLGPDYRIKTSLYAAARPDELGTLKSDLSVYGRGDPSFAARFNNGDYEKSLQPLVEALKAAGLKRIEGDLVGDATCFRGPPHGSGWTWDDLQYYYGAEVSALTAEDNVLDLVFSPGKRPGDPCDIAVKPDTRFVTFINNTKTVAKGGRRSIVIHRPLGANGVLVTGQMPLEDSPQTDAVAVHDPALFFVVLLKEALVRNGIAVTGAARATRWTDPSSTGADATRLLELASVESRSLREILGKMMKPSQNLYAQLLLLQAGAASEPEPLATSDPGKLAGSQLSHSSNATPNRASLYQRTSEEMGMTEMRKFLKEARIPVQEVQLEEGSGLSRSCLLTPNATVELLKFMHHHRHAAIFRESLPVAGVDGTLRNRMKKTQAEGNLRAKTGHIRYVDTLSGYVTTANGEPLAFSIMLNNYFNPNGTGREEVDALAVLLAELDSTGFRPAKRR